MKFISKAFGLPGWTERPAGDEQVQQILDRIEHGLKEGALGVGMLAGYAPGFGQKENYLVHKLAARHGVPTFIHVRYMGVLEPESSFAAYQEVVAMAASSGAQLPKRPSKEHRSALKKLEGTSGEQFDRAYVDQMVKDHEKALRLVQDAAKNAKNPELKQAAEKAAPEVKQHLDMAKQLGAKKSG